MQILRNNKDTHICLSSREANLLIPHIQATRQSMSSWHRGRVNRLLSELKGYHARDRKNSS
jgi:hypothetical protein